jgi:hypothetical protein
LKLALVLIFVTVGTVIKFSNSQGPVGTMAGFASYRGVFTLQSKTGARMVESYVSYLLPSRSFMATDAVLTQAIFVGVLMAIGARFKSYSFKDSWLSGRKILHCFMTAFAGHLLVLSG